MVDSYQLAPEAALAEFGTTTATGLNAQQVADAAGQYGLNRLPTESGGSFWKILLSQFTNIMVIILIVAAVLSYFIGDVKDVIVILVIVALNAALGTYQEFRAEQALAALSAMQVPNVRVRRDGRVSQISAVDLVPGDIVLLQEGDRVPADGRVVVSANLQVEEAALTGESQAVYKETGAIAGENVPLGDQINMAFMGTAVTYGRGEMIVTGTGLKTELGKIASMIMNVEEGKTPLQERLDQLTLRLIQAAVVIVVIVFIVGLLRGIPIGEMLITSISLAVAAIPEGLPAIITISLSMGAARMVKRNVLIRRLPAVETLGSVTTICSDKTGTLTRNQMTATRLALPGHGDVTVTGIGYDTLGRFVDERDKTDIDLNTDAELRRFIKAMALATDAYIDKDEHGAPIIVGDSTEGALVVTAQKVGWSRQYLEQDMKRVGELPFSSDRKAMTTIHDVETDENRALFPGGDFVAITKGAPDRLIRWATQEHMPGGAVPLTDARRQQWNSQINSMAAQGLRVLSVGYRALNEVPSPVTEEVERDLTLIGLIGIVDPSRPEARQAVATAKDAGIRTIMITGDHALTAEAIAADLGIIEYGERAITGSDIQAMDDAALVAAVKTTSAFARVSPEHKLRLVKALQSMGEITSMTGDGVNDAPALKQADIGVAMGVTGTEVSKGAADMVLTDDNFASIVAAIEEGRVIYDNIRKFVLFLLSSNVGEILVMFVGILVGLPIPLLAIQILWVNLVTDGLPAIALGFEPGEADIMRRPPRPRGEGILAQGMALQIGWRSVLLAVLTLFAFVWAHSNLGLDPMSPTRGLESLSRAQILTLAPEEDVPANWDTLTTEAQQQIVLARPAVTEQVEGEEAHSETVLIGHTERIPRTIAFTVLALGQIFHVISIHAGDRTSFFKVWFTQNRWMLGAVLLTFTLQLAVIYVPFLQATFDTYPLSLQELGISIALSSIMLFAVELVKVFMRRRAATSAPQAQPVRG